VNAFMLAKKLAKIYRLAGYETSTVEKASDPNPEGAFRFLVRGPCDSDSNLKCVYGAVFVDKRKDIDFIGTRKAELRQVLEG
jgi:hypothetical protein